MSDEIKKEAHKLRILIELSSEILKEAQTMSSLDHKHIVRLIGVCETDPLMIVMELAPLGPLNQYLIDHTNCVPINDIIALILQVAMAMEYLECRQYIHRDLAARNVLLVNDRFAKISDFGMSRALGIGKEYYRARSASKWPLKWYAPECIYYFKFSTKSDVWSFGVTLWEAVSYGQKPYEGMDGQDILRLFRENRRLPKPDNCPDEIYELMWKCWAFRYYEFIVSFSFRSPVFHSLFILSQLRML
ncbi:tyrosine-protein kinase ZAP-70-like protein [Dinothrombium tinctorium]|uniref:Tyrosine-protein kinase ZAP-70-like protein n=1 Tax=Dinothrombium tinctorium TaxID=1965070 RepID=A0A443QQ38_9ACAR|nr:tyrosine-protein kinase ZAP-70-like protein [Dinothrombium tinctorium]